MIRRMTAAQAASSVLERGTLNRHTEVCRSDRRVTITTTASNGEKQKVVLSEREWRVALLGALDL